MILPVMIWHYVVSSNKRGLDPVVHSKHRTKDAAQKRVQAKQKQFKAAGVFRHVWIMEEEGWHLGLPPAIKKIMLRDQYVSFRFNL